MEGLVWVEVTGGRRRTFGRDQLVETGDDEYEVYPESVTKLRDRIHPETRTTETKCRGFYTTSHRPCVHP